MHEDNLKHEFSEFEKKHARLSKVQEVENNLKAAKFKQEEREKTNEFKDMLKRNTQKQQVSEADRHALLNAKTSKERIRIRDSIDARTRNENERNAASARDQQNTMLHHISANGKTHEIKMSNKGLITPSSVLQSIKNTAGKLPSKVGPSLTSGIDYMAGALGTPVKNPNKMYNSNVKELSKSLKPHAKQPVTGGKVQPIPFVHSDSIMVNPDFMNSLMGRTPLQTQTSKKGKNTPAPRGLLSGLDDFAKRI